MKPFFFADVTPACFIILDGNVAFLLFYTCSVTVDVLRVIY